MKKLKIIFSIFFIIMLLSFKNINSARASAIDFRKEMRNLVELISKRAKKINPEFSIIPQNAMELIYLGSGPESGLAGSYLSAIDGAGCEELFYGYEGDGKKSPLDTTEYFIQYLKIIKKYGKPVLIIDYVKNQKQAASSFKLCREQGYISFQAERSLSNLSNYLFNENPNPVKTILDAKNFLCFLNGSKYKSPDIYLRSLKEAKHDMLVIDAFFWGGLLSKNDLNIINKKPSGAKRIALAYLSIGEAEDYRYYWKSDWKKNPPVFLEKENREWKGNFKVKYWMDEWKEIICGRGNGAGFENSYLKMIIDAGFDGVYLDIIDAAFYFENKKMH